MTTTVPTPDQLRQRGINRMKRWLKDHPECDKPDRLLCNTPEEDVLWSHVTDVADAVVARLSRPTLRQMAKELEEVWFLGNDRESDDLHDYLRNSLQGIIYSAIEKWLAAHYPDDLWVEDIKSLADLVRLVKQRLQAGDTQGPNADAGPLANVHQRIIDSLSHDQLQLLLNEIIEQQPDEWTPASCKAADIPTMMVGEVSWRIVHRDSEIEALVKGLYEPG